MTLESAPAWTFGDSLAQATRTLAEAGVPQPRRDARLLLAKAAGVEPAQVTAYPETPLPADRRETFLHLLGRRQAREPVARILGEREFWSLPIKITPAVLDPRPDSETLVEALLVRLGDREKPLDVLDLGTGSGCLLLALLSELPHARGLGVDVDPEALEVARDNASALELSGRASFRLGDWASGLIGRFDAVLCNPPYIASGVLPALDPEVALYDPRLALDGGHDGLDAYRLLIPQIGGILSTEGWLGLEIGWDQADPVRALLLASGFERVEGVADLAGRPRCLLARGMA